ncbi:MAG TPA: lipid II flippase MurJ [Candidatus Acidoferrum sp.]|nr:lipid II flippase MurJ [Candidatus Acidoferrum sp.]
MTSPPLQSEDSSGSSPGTGRSAVLVAAGILSSRLAGLIRDRVFAHFFGNSDAADAFRAAFRIPNFLQNLFGEGVLSASFIPVYAGLLAHKKPREAGEVAGAIAAILGLVVSLLVLLGLWTANWSRLPRTDPQAVSAARRNCGRDFPKPRRAAMMAAFQRTGAV